MVHRARSWFQVCHRHDSSGATVKGEYDDGSTEEYYAAQLAQVLGDAASHDCAGPCIDDVYAGQLTAVPGAQPYVHPVD